MFGLLAEEPEQIEQSYASCQPWPEQVVLDGERETLGLYLTGHPINQYLKEIERYVGGVRLKDMHPTERGSHHGCGARCCRAGYGHQARQSYRYLHAG